MTVQVVWSASGKTLCLWSAETGAWLGKIGGDRDLEEATPPLGLDFGGDSFSGSDHGGPLRIDSSKVPTYSIPSCSDRLLLRFLIPWPALRVQRPSCLKWSHHLSMWTMLDASDVFTCQQCVSGRVSR